MLNPLMLKFFDRFLFSFTSILLLVLGLIKKTVTCTTKNGSYLYLFISIYPIIYSCFFKKKHCVENNDMWVISTLLGS